MTIGTIAESEACTYCKGMPRPMFNTCRACRGTGRREIEIEVADEETKPSAPMIVPPLPPLPSPTPTATSPEAHMRNVLFDVANDLAVLWEHVDPRKAPSDVAMIWLKWRTLERGPLPQFDFARIVKLVGDRAK